jgi:hypothetical protein
MSLILDGTNGLSDVDGSAATPAIRGSDANTGMFFGTDIVGLSTDGTERMRVDASGNVGIGTSSPKSDVGLSLHLFNSASTGTVASNAFLLVESSTRNSVIELAGSSTSTNALNFSDTPGTAVAGIASSTADQNLLFRTGGTTERARIDSSGRLLVGVTSPLAGNFNNLINSSSESTVLISKSSGTASHLPLALLNTATSGDNKFTQFFTEASPVLRGEITYNRTAGLTAYNTTSDYRAKDISGPVTDSGTLIDSTPVYMGKMKGATQERPMFIAHETPDYAHTGEKDAVDADGKPVYQQMDASALIPVMWAELQLLRTRMAASEAIITALTARVEALEGAQA